MLAGIFVLRWEVLAVVILHTNFVFNAQSSNSNRYLQALFS